jgi:hypothetical protein
MVSFIHEHRDQHRVEPIWGCAAGGPERLLRSREALRDRGNSVRPLAFLASAEPSYFFKFFVDVII